MKIRIRKATANIQRVRAQKRRIASLETRRSVADIEGLKKIVRRMNIEQEKFSSEVQPFYQEVGRRKKILVAPHMATFDISPRMNLYRQRFLELSTKFDKLSEH